MELKFTMFLLYYIHTQKWFFWFTYKIHPFEKFLTYDDISFPKNRYYSKLSPTYTNVYYILPSPWHDILLHLSYKIVVIAWCTMMFIIQIITIAWYMMTFIKRKCHRCDIYFCKLSLLHDIRWHLFFKTIT